MRMLVIDQVVLSIYVFILQKLQELHRKNIHPVTWSLLLFLFLSTSVKEEEGIAAPMTEYLGGG